MILMLLPIVIGAFALPWAKDFVLVYVSILTTGLPAAIADRRYMEIRSDVHDHQRALAAEGYSPQEIGLHILWRSVRGIPSDLLWRFGEARAEARAHRNLGFGRVCLNALSAASDGHTYYSVRMHQSYFPPTFVQSPRRGDRLHIVRGHGVVAASAQRARSFIIAVRPNRLIPDCDIWHLRVETREPFLRHERRS